MSALSALPAALVGTRDRLLAAISAAGLREYSYDPGDACCDDHYVQSESFEPADLGSAARRLAPAWIGALDGDLPRSNLHPVDMLSALLEGEDYSDGRYPDLAADAVLVSGWVAAAGLPDPSQLRAALVSVLLEDREYLVKPSDGSVDGDWALLDPVDGIERAARLSPEDAALVAASAYPA